MIKLKDLVEAGVHFGHRTSKWHPKMAPYVWGAQNKIHLIDVSKTAFLLDRAGKFLTQTAASGKSILFVGTKKAAQEIIVKHATELKMPSVSHRWIGGTLSNFEQVKKAVTRLLHLRDICNNPLDRYTKKEQSVLQKERERLEKNVGGIVSLKTLPGALVVVDALKEQAAIREAVSMRIPVICLIDTNSDPAGIDYIVPGNDDSPKAISVIVAEFAAAVAAGIAARPAVAEAAAQELREATGAQRSDVIIEEETEEESARRKARPSRRTAGGVKTREGESTEADAPIRRRPVIRKKSSAPKSE